VSIPFTQYLMPDGRKQRIEIDMPDDIERMASAVLTSDGYFEAEVLPTAQVALYAYLHSYTPGEDDNLLSMQVVENGPPVVPAVENLVKAAYQSLQERDPNG